MSKEFTKGEEVNRGKTKAIFQTNEDEDLVVVASGDDITKNDNPDETKKLAHKAEFSTKTTSMVFELLKKAGIPVAYKQMLSPTEFLAEKCKMIPLEVIIRRYAVGSYLKRYPNLAQSDGVSPYRFHKLVFELFLKTTGGKILSFEKDELGVIPFGENGRPVDDPFIRNPYSFTEWHLMNPKLPSWDEKADLHISVHSDKIILGSYLSEMEEIARKTFLVLEGAWAQQGMRLIDFKIEFGINSRGELVISDVIDNDSWRLRTSDWQELSKQLFRDNADMQLISEKYEMVAKLVSYFRIPDQSVILWRASESDSSPCFPEVVGINQMPLVISGHKNPEKCLGWLEDNLSMHPEGGVIIASVGMSNGLGPILAARTNWPVIAVPLTVKESPHDVWSSLEMPSNVPLLTCLSQKNAVLAALNILAQKNPVAYMTRQYAIEELVD